MSKKSSFSFEGLVDPSSMPDPPPGVSQRGAETSAASSEVRRGRPPKARTASEARPSFGLDPDTHRLFKIWLLEQGISMQDYLEGHIKSLLENSKR